MLHQFVFKGNRYLTGTIVKVHDSQRQNFKYYRYLKFIESDGMQCYKFCSLYDCWENFKISEKELEKYIDEIVTPIIFENIEIKYEMESKDVEGIVPAWTWYILALIASLFISGMFSKILMPIVAFCIFAFWRSKKMRGE